jgi:hypothetical protein
MMLHLQGIRAVLGILSLCACKFLITLEHCAGLDLGVVWDMLIVVMRPLLGSSSANFCHDIEM